MAKYSIEDSTLTNIANAIRAKTGGTAALKPTAMDEALNGIPTQAAKTVTPSTADQTAVAKGVFTTGAVTVKGDANLKAENIAEGVSIFGVVGSHSGKKTVRVTITIEAYITGVAFYYFDKNGVFSSGTTANKTYTIDALDGIVVVDRGLKQLESTGDYLGTSAAGLYGFLFHSDGGSIRIYTAGGGSED